MFCFFDSLSFIQWKQACGESFLLLWHECADMLVFTRFTVDDLFYEYPYVSHFVFIYTKRNLIRCLICAWLRECAPIGQTAKQQVNNFVVTLFRKRCMWRVAVCSVGNCSFCYALIALHMFHSVVVHVNGNSNGKKMKSYYNDGDVRPQSEPLVAVMRVEWAESWASTALHRTNSKSRAQLRRFHLILISKCNICAIFSSFLSFYALLQFATLKLLEFLLSVLRMRNVWN